MNILKTLNNKLIELNKKIEDNEKDNEKLYEKMAEIQEELYKIEYGEQEKRDGESSKEKKY